MKRILAIAAAFSVFAAPAAVWAEDSFTEEIVDFTAEDGASGKLIYENDENGELVFSSYDIDSPAPDKEVFLNLSSPEFEWFAEDTDFYDKVNEQNADSGKEYIPAVVPFYLEFDPVTDSGLISADGGKCYCIDVNNRTVEFVGMYALVEELVASEEYSEDITVHAACTAEDGAKIYLSFYPNPNGGFDYLGDEAEIIDVTSPYDFPEYSNTEGHYFSAPDDIDLEDNEILITVPYQSEFEPISFMDRDNVTEISGYKLYIAALDGENSSVRYAGHTVDSVLSYEKPSVSDRIDNGDGFTELPKTGNFGGYETVSLAALTAVLAAAKRKQ